MVLKDWKRINTHVWESIRPLMWQWLSPAQTVLLSQVMQAQQGREFLIGVGRHFCRLVGQIYILISERDMIVLKYGARLSLKVSLPFSSGKWVMGFAGVYPSLSSSHVTQRKLVHYPMHQCVYQGDKNMPFEGYCSRLVLLLQSSFSWLTDRKIWDRFEVISSTLGYVEGYGATVHFEGGATNGIERTVVNK